MGKAPPIALMPLKAPLAMTLCLRSWHLALAALGASLAITVLGLLPDHGPGEGTQIAAHVAAFALLAFLYAAALPRLPLAGLALAFALGCAIEAAQHFVPGRTADLMDIAANTIGALLGGAAYFSAHELIRRMRRPG